MYLKTRDDMHINLRSMMGYNKKFNFCVSAREAGKSTSAILDLVWSAYKKGRPSIVLRRDIADITDDYIQSFADIINDFTDANIELTYKKTEISKGVFTIYVKGDDKPFIRLIAMKVKKTRFKSTTLPNVKYIIFDEFLPDTTLGEGYVKGETNKFSEILKTYKRESPDIKCIFLGNVYTLYSPYISELTTINPYNLKPGDIATSDEAIVWYYKLDPRLVDYIRKRDPEFIDETFDKYCVEGLAVNDEQIRIVNKFPQNFKLSLIFKFNRKFIMCYRGVNDDYSWWVDVQSRPDIGKRRDVYCIDWNDMNQGYIFLEGVERDYFYSIKKALQFYDVVYSTPEGFYLLQQIYNQL